MKQIKLITESLSWFLIRCFIPENHFNYIPPPPFPRVGFVSKYTKQPVIILAQGIDRNLTQTPITLVPLVVIYCIVCVRLFWLKHSN
jgi:hypothetical protein